MASAAVTVATPWLRRLRDESCSERDTWVRGLKLVPLAWRSGSRSEHKCPKPFVTYATWGKRHINRGRGDAI